MEAITRVAMNMLGRSNGFKSAFEELADFLSNQYDDVETDFDTDRYTSLRIRVNFVDDSGKKRWINIAPSVTSTNNWFEIGASSTSKRVRRTVYGDMERVSDAIRGLIDAINEEVHELQARRDIDNWMRNKIHTEYGEYDYEIYSIQSYWNTCTIILHGIAKLELECDENRDDLKVTSIKFVDDRDISSAIDNEIVKKMLTVLN